MRVTVEGITTLRARSTQNKLKRTGFLRLDTQKILICDHSSQNELLRSKLFTPQLLFGTSKLNCERRNVDTDVRSNPFCTQPVSHERSLVNLPGPALHENAKNKSKTKDVNSTSKVQGIKRYKTALLEMTLALL